MNTAIFALSSIILVFFGIVVFICDQACPVDDED
jgi:hypothetical protein